MKVLVEAAVTVMAMLLVTKVQVMRVDIMSER